MTIERCRREIDTIDTEILGLLKRRAGISKEIGRLKLGAGLPVADRAREGEILRRLTRENQGTMRDQTVLNIYHAILRESRRIQLDALMDISVEQEVCQ